jgi:uncharacterized protein YjiS (DUF1127 family)
MWKSSLAWTGMALSVWLVVEAAWIRRRQRRQLLGLDDRHLKDIGISRCDAMREAAKWW